MQPFGQAVKPEHQGVFMTDPKWGYPTPVTVTGYSDDLDIITRDTNTGGTLLVPTENFAMYYDTKENYEAAEKLNEKLAADAAKKEAEAAKKQAESTK